MLPRPVRNQPLASWLIVGFLILPGCASTQPVMIQVRDAETRQPISNAQVHIWYPNDPPGQARSNTFGKTEADGIARMELSPDPKDCPLAELTAHGYLWQEKSLPGLPDRKTTATVPNVAFELYAEPRPTVDLVIPNFYRGLVEVKMQIQDDAPATPGLRAFRAVVSPQGNAELIGPAILHYVGGPGFRAMFADGTVLKRETKEFDEVGFWWLKGDETDQLFLVGTKDEYEAHRRSALQSEGTRTHSSDGKGGGKGSGKGGGGRHGGSSDGSGGSGGATGTNQ